MEPKYKLGQEVWYIKDKKAILKEIVGLVYLTKEFTYFLKPDIPLIEKPYQISESDLFHTKEDLIKSL